MKNFAIYLILFVACQFLVGCDKDEDSKPNVEFNLDNIKQTGWKGTLTINNADKTDKTDVGLLFVTEKVGHYETPEVQAGNFDYIVDGKKIVISGLQARDLEGNWMLIEFSDDKLILKEGLHSETYNKTLELARTYK
ncbi:MAG TPA: hypothetical protein VKZ98_02395 [Aquaticitalea sp.]|nr:hypothetical protein [Aquaticitalea sp.]